LRRITQSVSFVLDDLVSVLWSLPEAGDRKLHSLSLGSSLIMSRGPRWLWSGQWGFL